MVGCALLPLKIVWCCVDDVVWLVTVGKSGFRNKGVIKITNYNKSSDFLIQLSWLSLLLFILFF